MITRDNLYTFLNNIDSLENKTLNLYAIIKDWDNSTIKKINIDVTTSNWLTEKYSTLAKSYLWDEVVFKSIDEYDDESSNVYYYFENCTPEMEFIKDIWWWIQENFSIDEIKNIEWIIVKIWNQNEFCNLYVPYYPIYLLDREKWALLFSDNSQFKSFESDKVLRFNNQITFLYYKKQEEDIVLSFDFERIEKNFWYEKEFTKRANTKIEAIENLWFISDVGQFKWYIESKKWLRNKLIKIQQTSEVFNKSVQEIKNFVDSKPFLASKINFDTDGKITITSEEKARIFLKLLDDDYLKSDLTEWEYETDKKSKIS